MPGPLELSTDQPLPGSTVMVSGSGFAAGSEVSIEFESTPVLLATATADASGNFSVAVVIPSSASGQHSLIATGLDPQGAARILTSTVEVGGATGGGGGMTPPPTAAVPGMTAATSDGWPIVILGLLAFLAGIMLVDRRRTLRRRR